MQHLYTRNTNTTDTYVIGVLQRACACGNHTKGSGECEECQKKKLQRKTADQAESTAVPPLIHEVLRSPGQPLDPATRAFMEPRFGHDFSQVRVHTDAKAVESARAVNALAYTVGRDVVFGPGRYAPGTNEGKQLLAHELTHVVQQGMDRLKTVTGIGKVTINEAQEVEADRAADAVRLGTTVSKIGHSGGVAIQRQVEMQNVGRGEQSGFARLPELINRLNAISQGLTFSMTGNELTYEVRQGGTLSEFDRQMQGFIDQNAAIPLRLTNRHGLLGTRATGFNTPVFEDAWASGYVDIDDLLASSDLGLQTVLVHFLRERAETRNYARRIGSSSMDFSKANTQQEFSRVHALGIDSEVDVLHDYFDDPSIRFIGPGGGRTARVFRNSRRDSILTQVRSGHGQQRDVHAISIQVITRNGTRYTAEEYRRILEEERRNRQIQGERLRGADEHRAGGRGVPAP